MYVKKLLNESFFSILQVFKRPAIRSEKQEINLKIMISEKCRERYKSLDFKFCFQDYYYTTVHL